MKSNWEKPWSKEAQLSIDDLNTLDKMIDQLDDLIAQLAYMEGKTDIEWIQSYLSKDREKLEQAQADLLVTWDELLEKTKYTKPEDTEKDIWKDIYEGVETEDLFFTQM